MIQLSAPFPPEAIHWRAQTLTKDGTKALALAYIDARDVMDRLDEAVGPNNWQDTYVETPKGRIICTLSIRIDGEWIAKSDGAGETAVEGEKGGISDALKRAAVKWGIGRYLYDLGNVWAPCESRDNNGRKQWVKWRPEAQRVFEDALKAIEGPPPPLDIDNPPDSVRSFLKGLEAAFKNGTAPKYWTDNHKAIPAEWLPHASNEKERMKQAANTNEPTNNLQAG